MLGRQKPWCLWLAQVFSDLPKLTRTPRYGVVAPACKGGTHGSGRPCRSEARSVEILPSTPLEERSFQKARRTASPAREPFGGSGECGATPEFPDRAHGTRWATGLLTAPAPPLPRHRSNGELGATSQAPRAVSGSQAFMPTVPSLVTTSRATSPHRRRSHSPVVLYLLLGSCPLEGC